MNISFASRRKSHSSGRFHYHLQAHTCRFSLTSANASLRMTHGYIAQTTAEKMTPIGADSQAVFTNRRRNASLEAATKISYHEQVKGIPEDHIAS